MFSSDFVIQFSVSLESLILYFNCILPFMRVFVFFSLFHMVSWVGL